MSLLDDARTLFEKLDRGGDGPWADGAYHEMICLACGTDIHEERQPPDCPWLSMPKIIAVLETAERVVEFWDEAYPEERLAAAVLDLEAALKDEAAVKT